MCGTRKWCVSERALCLSVVRMSRGVMLFFFFFLDQLSLCVCVCVCVCACVCVCVCALVLCAQKHVDIHFTLLLGYCCVGGRSLYIHPTGLRPWHCSLVDIHIYIHVYHKYILYVPNYMYKYIHISINVQCSKTCIHIWVCTYIHHHGLWTWHCSLVNHIFICLYLFPWFLKLTLLSGKLYMYIYKYMYIHAYTCIYPFPWSLKLRLIFGSLCIYIYTSIPMVLDLHTAVW